YGGGTVMLWDRGYWLSEDGDAAAAYRKGHLKFRLIGEKLRGRWVLVRMGGRAARETHENWLLIKERDDTAEAGSGAAVTEDNPTSVASGRDMAAIAEAADRVWDSTEGEVRGRPETPRETRRTADAPLPQIVPQLATVAAEVPEGEEWLHEIKFDGYRILARIENGEVVLLSRNGLDWTAKFPEIAAALAELPVGQAAIDGEVVALDAEGRSSFSALQQALSEGRTAALVYFAFDLLHREGEDLRASPLESRKEALRKLVAAAGRTIRYSDHQTGHGAAFLDHACRAALEGIVSKRRGTPYRAGRSRAWLKIKCGNREEFIIVGYSDPAGTRIGFGALLLGFFDPGGILRYAGRVGTGFDERLLKALHRRLARLAVKQRPVAALPKGVTTRGVHWVEPSLVAEIRFAEWTRDDVLRHAVFLGLREDKPAREVVFDRSASRPVKPAPGNGAARPLPQSSDRPAISRDGSTRIDGVRLTNAAKILYPGEGIANLDLATYYHHVARWALPHLAGRPLAIVRCPEGEKGECFFQKHVSAGMPEAIKHAEIAEEGGAETVLYIADAAGLVSLAQLGALEIHPWGSTLRRIEQPDRLIFDLDPDEALSWDRMIEAALAVKGALARLGLESFAKTTGGKGLHVVVPVTPRLPWPEAKAFTKAIADGLVAAAPERYTATLAKRARRGKIFIDYLRNGRGATAVGAFSTRARPGAPVSAPLSWSEVEGGIRSDQFTIANLPERLAAQRRDPWNGFFDLKQSISAKARKAVGL
ncbi:MAG: DNA ligase D, partial [Alphaproteobacteria bacterium]|nr:DNA ligase D [Alphaproteobacteria bacterium]